MNIVSTKCNNTHEVETTRVMPTGSFVQRDGLGSAGVNGTSIRSKR
jgi:hypothetical protein